MDDRVFPFLVVRTPPGVHGQLRLAIENGDGDAEFEAARQFQVAYDCLPADSVIRDHMTWPLYFGLRLHDAEQDPPFVCSMDQCMLGASVRIPIPLYLSVVERRRSPRPTLVVLSRTTVESSSDAAVGD